MKFVRNRSFDRKLSEIIVITSTLVLTKYVQYIQYSMYVHILLSSADLIH